MNQHAAMPRVEGAAARVRCKPPLLLIKRRGEHTTRAMQPCSHASLCVCGAVGRGPPFSEPLSATQDAVTRASLASPSPPFPPSPPSLPLAFVFLSTITGTWVCVHVIRLRVFA